MKIGATFLLPLLVSVFPVIAFSDAPVVVAGAGPASLMFALRYLQLNPDAKIEIFERRPKPPRFCETSIDDCVAGDQAFGFGIGTRAQHHLKKIPGLYEAVSAVGHPIKSGAGSAATTWMVNRRDLCAECIHLLEKRYGSDGNGRLRIHFNCAVSAIVGYAGKHYNSSVIVEDFCSSTESSRSVPYSLLVGGDGMHSSIRSCLIGKGFISGKRYSSGSSWKALQMPSQAKLGEDGQILSYKNFDDVGRLLPRYKGRFVLLNFRRKKAINQNPFGSCSPLALKRSIQAVMPNVTDFPPDNIIQSFLDQPAGDTFYMTLDKHYVSETRTFLIGDAAVGMYSLLGQGCVYAIESAARLAEHLAMAPLGSENEKVMKACSKTNQVEGKALADLNLISHIRSKPLIMNVCKGAIQNIFKGLTDPSDPYATIARRSRWAILLSKPFWWFARTRAPLEKKRNRA